MQQAVRRITERAAGSRSRARARRVGAARRRAAPGGADPRSLRARPGAAPVQRATQSRSSTERACAARTRHSRRRSGAETAHRDWKIMPMSRRCTGVSVTSSPPTTMRPASGSSKPAIMRRLVVLPQPDGSSRAKNSPGCTVRSMQSTTRASRRRSSSLDALKADFSAHAQIRRVGKGASPRDGISTRAVQRRAHRTTEEVVGTARERRAPLPTLRSCVRISPSAAWSRARRCRPCARCTISSRPG